MRRHLSRRQPPRRGAILVVVLSMLTLLALLGVTFVLYATATRQSARLAVEAQNQRRPDADPERLLAYFLNQFLFDVPDDERGVYSGLRGHSLARNMLGLDYQYLPDGGIRRDTSGDLIDDAGNLLNEVPFNGTGRQHFDPGLPFAGAPDDSPAKDDHDLVNYTWFPRDGMLRDPERRGWRDKLPDPGAADNRKPYVGGFNAPYTYPDLNNLYLAAVKADGRVLLPSFHRPWAGFGPIGPGNWRWTANVDPTLSPDDPLYNVPQPWLKYLVLRPRPIDMAPGFPLPEDDGGDVKNLPDAPGGNDSLWLDLGHPVVRSADGRKFKPLFAPLVVDLDSRVNLNVHGNLRGTNRDEHASNQGWGPWEVNPALLVPLPDRNAPDYPAAVARRAEWTRLLSGVRPSGPGRYGWDKAPHSAAPGNRATAPVPRFYAPVDFDGSREEATGTPSVVGRPSARLRLPGTRRTPPWTCFPTVTTRSGYGNSSDAERQDHPSLHDPFRPRRPDGAFALSDLEALARHGDTGSQALGSALLRLAPKNFRDPSDATESARRRRMVTLASFDQDRPGVMPWFRTSSLIDAAYSRLPPRELAPEQSPYHPTGQSVGPFVPGSEFESEIGPDGRVTAALTAMRRLNLNRYLPAFPTPDPTAGRITDTLAFQVAQRARQHFAAELFELLWKATGAGDPTRMPPPGARDHETARWDALRYLAQLAVNVVDFLDEDDCMTPFNWFTDPQTRNQEWVHGTELPRVVVNEVYAEYVNLPDDPGLNQRPPVATRLKGNVWVELHDPFKDDPPLVAPHRKAEARLEVQATDTEPAFGVYRVVLARLTGDIRQPDNVRGEVPATAGFTLATLSSFGPQAGANPPSVDTRLILGMDPNNNQGYSAPLKENKGFYLLGPNPGPQEAYPFTEPIETLRRSEMSYVVRANYDNLLLKPSVLLQRLACPYLPPQPDASQPLYNPYLTVDYVRDVPANYAAEVGIDGPGAPSPVVVPERYSVGRRQPYAAHPSQLYQQDPDPPLEGQPQHSFFQHNVDKTTAGPNTPDAPADYAAFDWLVHLDRQAISVMELLHVSAFKPHELTQQFRTGDTDREKFTHRAPWLDEGLDGSGAPQSYRLYRALEFLTTGSRLPSMMRASTTGRHGVPTMALDPPYVDQRVFPEAMAGVTVNGGSWRIEVGTSLVIDRGLASEEVVRVKAIDSATKPLWFEADFLTDHASGFTIAPLTVSERIPGRLNLNTIWDEEVFLALCDPTRANSFHDATARLAFKQLRDSRTVSGDTPGPNDRPLLGLGAPATATDGVQSTMFRTAGQGSRVPILGVPGQQHPYQTMEMLTKIFNNATVRSNVFAAWLTVGFFEVADDSARPVKLGAEIGRAEGRHVRHRMFAVVDRSVLLRNPGPRDRFDPREPTPAFATGPVVPYFSIID